MAVMASQNSRSFARSQMAFLVMVWTLMSIFNDARLYANKKINSNSNSRLSFSLPIVLVEAVWYSEICHTGPRYKVRIDPLTGNVVPVYHRYSSDNESTGAVATIDTKDGENSSIDDDPAVDEIQNSEETTNSEDGSNNPGGDRNRRVLRSNRFWRDFDEDSETDAIVISRKKNGKNMELLGVEEDLRLPAKREQHSRSLWELKPGEFYVKPCICQDSRWTFAPDAGLQQQTTSLPPTVYNNNDIDNYIDNDTTDTIIQQPPQRSGNDFDFDGSYNADVIFHPNPQNSPNNFGLLPNNQLAYVADGVPDGDLYLCRVQAMYCGVLVDLDSNFNPIVKCYDQNMRHIIARNAWPLILLWYFGLAIICCCTVHGRTAGDYVQDRLSYYCKKFVCCFRETSYDFNDRMLNRMIRDDERERRRRNGYRRTSDNDEEEDDEDLRPWYFSNQRLQFERSLMAQVQWIWRHQEYIREVNLREEGLPPPQLRLKVKRFKMGTSTSNSKEGGFSKTPPPISVTTESSSKEDIVGNSLQQQNRTDFPSRISSNGSNGKTLPSENGNDGERESVASTAAAAAEKRPSDESTCSSSSAENILVHKDNACCTICPDESSRNVKNRDSRQQLPLQEQEDEEYVTLDFGPEIEQEGVTDCGNAEASREEYASDLDSQDAPTCTICFCAFEEGDRIGDLTCKHEFHIDCLKGWLQRKNACPLCNVRLGKPERPVPPRHDESHNNNESSIEDSRHSLSGLSLMQRLRGLRQNSTSNNNNINNNSISDGAGEIQIGRRIGMIGAVSAAADISAARERVARRSNHGR